MSTKHNQYCCDDWDMYHGDGPRGMGPRGEGCVCSLAPNPGSVAASLARAYRAVVDEPYRPDPPPILSAHAKQTYDQLAEADWDLGSPGGDHGLA